MKHGSLFSGIGGFDLAAQWMGWENVFHCEWNPFGQEILKHYWPNAKSYTDITKTDFTIHRGTIDVLTGGFPCQPYSQAGKRKGTADDRHLWPQMLRAIREIQPRFIVGENVRGLTNWNGGLVFDQVQAEMEIEGYEVLPFLLPACAVGAPHRRDRILFIAYSMCNGMPTKTGKLYKERKLFCSTQREEIKQQHKSIGSGRITSNSPAIGFQGSIQANSQEGKERNDKFINGCSRKRIASWEQFPTQSPVCNGNDGLSSRLDGITFSKWRNESIKGVGNAVVPQLAYEIFKCIDRINAPG